VLACVEKRGELRWVVGCSLGGRGGMWKKKGKKKEKQRKRECRQRQYILAFTDGLTDGIFRW
jgi:hypothetical protein